MTKLYVLLEINTTAPERTHDRLVRRAAREMRRQQGDDARTFQIPADHECVGRVVQGSTELVGEVPKD